MITFSQVNQYVSANGIDDSTDIFSILSQMQLEYKAISPIIEKPILTASKVEYSIQDVLDLFST
jgi:hypothetical protein